MSFFTGNRGLTLETWSTIVPREDLNDVARYTRDQADFMSSRVLENSAIPESLQTTPHSGRMTGFFVPHRDGRYHMLIRGIGSVGRLKFTDQENGRPVCARLLVL